MCAGLHPELEGPRHLSPGDPEAQAVVAGCRDPKETDWILALCWGEPNDTICLSSALLQCDESCRSTRGDLRERFQA